MNNQTPQKNFNCAYCGKENWRHTGLVNRARRLGLNLYCNRECAGLGRRKNYTEDEKKKAKKLYDIEYRKKNKERIKRKKAEYFQKTYNPEKAAKERAEKKEWWIRAVQAQKKIINTPQYRAYKKEYDRKYRAKKLYGEYNEAYLKLRELEDLILSKATKYEICLQNGTLNKKTERKRSHEKFNSDKLERSPLGNP